MSGIRTVPLLDALDFDFDVVTGECDIYSSASRTVDGVVEGGIKTHASLHEEVDDDPVSLT